MSQLPAAYSLAIRLRDTGVPDELIAACLGVEVVAVGPLMIVAEAKLEAILHSARSE